MKYDRKIELILLNSQIKEDYLYFIINSNEIIQILLIKIFN